MKSFSEPSAAIFLILFSGLLTVPAHSADWVIKDAPYRAKIRLVEPANDPEAGVSIELPDFGAERSDLTDAVLIDSKGMSLPLKPFWHGNGQHALSLFVAKGIEPTKDYFLYFGGENVRLINTWTPRLGLFLETRRLGPLPKIDSWNEMQNTWREARQVDGAGFVPSIYTAGNPFGGYANYASHYTGLLLTSSDKEEVLYTLSSDASFVLVDDRLVLEWPGIHSQYANEKTVKKTSIPATEGLRKIDYYQAKIGEGESSSMLGWVKNGHFEAVPPSAWVHPGRSKVLNIEQKVGLPVPEVSVHYNSCIGFGGYWLYDVVIEPARSIPKGWDLEWHFEDGNVFPGDRCERIMTGGRPQSVTLFCRKGDVLIQGVGQLKFPENTASASVKNPTERASYITLISKENPNGLSAPALESMLPLLIEYAANDLTGRFATAWLSKAPPSSNPLWLPAQLSAIRMMAQTNPQKALEYLRSIDPVLRKEHNRELSMLELDLLVFYLRDPSAQSVAHRIAFDLPKTEVEELSNIRIGDLYRLTEHPDLCVQQYAAVQKTVTDETGGRKLPTMDRSYSITVDYLLGDGLRQEADQKLREWEIVHPMAKIDSDFLLLQARMLNSFGYWTESLTELDSFKKMHRDSPYEITADFYRAEALLGLGKKDEARKIWSAIAKDFPNHELATKCRELLSKS